MSIKTLQTLVCKRSHFQDQNLHYTFSEPKREYEQVEWLTIMHGHTLVFDTAYIAAQLVLPVRILYQLCLNGEAPHVLQCCPLQLHLVQDLSTHLHYFMCVQLKHKFFTNMLSLMYSESSGQSNY